VGRGGAQGFAATEGDAQQGIKPDEMVHVGVGDEDVARAQEASRAEGLIVTEVEQQGALGPSHLDEQPGISEQVIDEEAGKGRIHSTARS